LLGRLILSGTVTIREPKITGFHGVWHLVLLYSVIQSLCIHDSGTGTVQICIFANVNVNS